MEALKELEIKLFQTTESNAFNVGEGLYITLKKTSLQQGEEF